MRRLLQLLLHEQWRSVLPMHIRQLPLQVRVHRRRLHNQLHQRRQATLRPIAGLLRMLQQVLRKRLLLLRVLRQHPGVLRKLLSQAS